MTLRQQTHYQNSLKHARKEQFLAVTEIGSTRTVQRKITPEQDTATWKRLDSPGWVPLPEEAAKSLEADYQKGEYESIEDLEQREARVRR